MDKTVRYYWVKLFSDGPWTLSKWTYYNGEISAVYLFGADYDFWEERDRENWIVGDEVPLSPPNWV